MGHFPPHHTPSHGHREHSHRHHEPRHHIPKRERTDRTPKLPKPRRVTEDSNTRRVPKTPSGDRVPGSTTPKIKIGKLKKGLTGKLGGALESLFGTKKERKPKHDRPSARTAGDGKVRANTVTRPSKETHDKVRPGTVNKPTKATRREAPPGSPVRGKISSEYGPRSDPKAGTPAIHHGVDIAAPIGTAVRATGDGVVTKAAAQKKGDLTKGYGLRIELSHGGGNVSEYGHLSRIDVVVGQKITRGQVIGAVGNTGKSTGPHLHYEERHDGKSHEPTFNPRTYRPSKP